MALNVNESIQLINFRNCDIIEIFFKFCEKLFLCVKMHHDVEMLHMMQYGGCMTIQNLQSELKSDQ